MLLILELLILGLLVNDVPYFARHVHECTLFLRLVLLRTYLVNKRKI